MGLLAVMRLRWGWRTGEVKRNGEASDGGGSSIAARNSRPGHYVGRVPAKRPMPDPASSGSFLLPILIFLAAAVIAVPLFRAVGMGAAIGYLAAGVISGPHALGFVRPEPRTAPTRRTQALNEEARDIAQSEQERAHAPMDGQR